MQRDNRVENLFASTSSLARLWKAYFYKVLGPEKLSPTLMGLLFYLGVHQPAKGRSIADGLHLSPSATAQQLDGLDQLGYIERVVDPTDRRVTFFSLSAKGKLKLTAIDDKRRQFFTEVTETLSSDEIEALLEIQEKMARHLKEISLSAVTKDEKL